MPSFPPSSSLDEIRLRVVTTVRALRLERHWTQAELAQRLGLSQARLSEIERGGGSFSAEQLITILGLFNVGLDAFMGPQPLEDQLQNALARLGAAHLREVPTSIPSARLVEVRAAVREALLSPRDSRILLALAPVIVAQIDFINLDLLHDDLVQVGFPQRAPWLVENVHSALALVPVPASRADASRWHRARTVLGDFVARHPPPEHGEHPRPLDYLDLRARSEHSLAEVKGAASPISKRWGVVSDLLPSHFAEALREAHDAV